MSIQDLGSIGELVAAVATLGTLVYLALQIRANTIATRANATWNAHDTFAHLNDLLASGGSLADVAFRSTHPDASLNDFTDKEKFQLQMFGRGMFQRLESQYFLYREGLLDPGIWENRRRFNRALLNRPVWREFWESEVRNHQFTEAFIQHINEANPDDVIFLGQRTSA